MKSKYKPTPEFRREFQKAGLNISKLVVEIRSLKEWPDMKEYIFKYKLGLLNQVKINRWYKNDKEMMEWITSIISAIQVERMRKQ